MRSSRITWEGIEAAAGCRGDAETSAAAGCGPGDRAGEAPDAPVRNSQQTSLSFNSFRRIRSNNDRQRQPCTKWKHCKVKQSSDAAGK